MGSGPILNMQTILQSNYLNIMQIIHCHKALVEVRSNTKPSSTAGQTNAKCFPQKYEGFLINIVY